jgi:hypothetical protein
MPALAMVAQQPVSRAPRTALITNPWIATAVVDLIVNQVRGRAHAFSSDLMMVTAIPGSNAPFHERIEFLAMVVARFEVGSGRRMRRDEDAIGLLREEVVGAALESTQRRPLVEQMLELSAIRQQSGWPEAARTCGGEPD